MKTVQLEIDDKDYESFLTIINNLKKGFVKKIIVNDSIEFVSNKEQIFYEELIKNISDDEKTISSKESIQL